MQPDPRCGCTRSLAVVCALFAGLAAALFLAQDACLDAGGKLSDAAWACELASGAASLWTLVAPAQAGFVLVAVVVPVFLVVDVLGRRLRSRER